MKKKRCCIIWNRLKLKNRNISAKNRKNIERKCYNNYTNKNRIKDINRNYAKDKNINTQKNTQICLRKHYLRISTQVQLQFLITLTKIIKLANLNKYTSFYL